jgi:integrase/recombinase XerD
VAYSLRRRRDKGGELIDCAWPETLTAYLELYLDRYRPELLRLATSPDAVRALWVAKRGAAMSPDAIQVQITNRTKEAFGRSINPHAFRHIAATTIASCDPEGAADIKAVLNHSSIATSERHYNRASMLGAGSAYQQALQQLRSQGAVHSGF